MNSIWSDADIVRRVRSGESEAYSLLVERYQNTICGLAYAQLGNFEDARDVAQDAFVQAYLRLEQLLEPDKYAPWIKQITINQCRMWRRGHHETQSLDEIELAIPRLDTADTRLTVQQAMQCLSPSSRLTLALFHWHCYSLEETALLLEVPITTVKSRLRNARARLKKEMMTMIEDALKQEQPNRDWVQQVMEMIAGGTVWALSFAPDGKTLASAASDGYVKLWDARSGASQRVLGSHERAVDDVAFSLDGRLVASAGRDSTIKIWHAHSGKLQRTLKLDGRPLCVAFAPNASVLVTVSSVYAEVDGEIDIIGSKVTLWDLANENVCRELETLHWNELHPAPDERGARFYSAAFSPDGHLVATGNSLVHGNATSGGEVKLWDVASGRLQRVISIDDFMVQAVAFSPDGTTVAAACTRVIGAPATQTVPAAAAGRFFAQLRLWRVADGEPVRAIVEEEGWWLKTLAFSPDGRTLAVGRMQTAQGNVMLCDVRLWSLESGLLLQTISDGRSERSSFAFAPDAQTLATGGKGHSIKLWRLNGNLVHGTP